MTELATRPGPESVEQATGDAAARAGVRLGYRTQFALVRATGDAAALEAIRKQAFDASAIDGQELVLVRSTISTDKPDAYETVMDASSLQNFAADAAVGVSVLYGHDTYQIVGRSFSGQYITRGGARVESECFIPGGLNLAGVSTDEVIRALGLGILRDVSVGFWGYKVRCSICGLSLWDMNCPHVPGVAYKVEGKRNPVVALAVIADARLGEYSLVYDGATPDASVLAVKALQEADAGRLAPEEARALETQYRVRLPGAAHLWALGTRARPAAPAAEPAEEEPVTMPVVPPAGAPLDPETVRALVATVLPDAADPMAGLTELIGELTRLRQGAATAATLEARVAELEPLAADGRAYRAETVKAALANGVRALKEKFEEAKWTELLGRMPIEQVRTLSDAWALQGEANFPPGRQTSEEEGDPRSPTPLRPMHARGFRA